MSERLPKLSDAEFDALVQAEGTWHRWRAPEDKAETRLAQHARQAREDVKRLAGMLQNFAEMAEAAVAHHERPKTGMQVPFHGDFAHVPPSAVARLRWWAREMRTLLSEVTTP